MMAGVIAQDPAPSSVSFLPTPLGSFDFVNGVYDWNGTSYAAADIVDQVGWIGAGGLQVPAAQGAGAQILLSAATAFLAGCQFSCVAEIEAVASTEQLILTVADSTNFDSIDLEFWDEFSLIDQNTFVIRNLAGDFFDYITQRVAFARTDARAAVTGAGFPVASYSFSTVSCTLPEMGDPMVRFYLGGWNNATVGAVNIHSIKFYTEILTNAELRAISA